MSARADEIQRHIAGPTAPSAVAAERGLIGIVLADPGALEELDGDLKGDDFYEPVHGRIWDVIGGRRAKGLATDPTVLDGLMLNDEAYRANGGLPWVEALVEVAPGPSKAQTYATEIREAARRRALLTLADDIAKETRETPETAKVIGKAARRLGEIELGAIGDYWVTAGDAIGGAIERARTRNGVIDFPFGLPSLDRVTGGMHGGEVTLLGARPGMGKTVAGLSVARANASARLGVCLFSKEMTREAVGMRIACDLCYPTDHPATVYFGAPTRPTFDKAMKGELSEDYWEQLAEAADIARGWPMLIDDRSGLTVAQIEAAVRRKHREWALRGVKPGPVIIDHIGKIRPPVDRRGNKYAEMADISNELAAMAKRLHEVPVLGLVQLNRGVESRDDKRPQLSDLRQAGELEEDARQVIFLFRPEYYLRDGAPDESAAAREKREAALDAAKNQLFWIIEKNSHGPRAQVRTFIEIACSAVREFAA